MRPSRPSARPQRVLPTVTAFVIMTQLLLFAGTTGAARAQALGDHRYTTDAIETGSRVYTAECAICHGPNGNEVDGVNLRTGRFSRSMSDDDLREVITTGIDGARMPGFDFRVEEMDGVIAFIRAGFDPEGVAVRIGDAAQGRAVFEGAGDCASCHRVNGVGPRTAPDLSDIGAIRTPATLQRTILDPASALLPIHRPVRAVTRDGEVVEGRRLNEDTYTVQLIDSNERLRSLVKAELSELVVSETPTMEPSTLSSDEVADLIGYLLTLRGQS